MGRLPLSHRICFKRALEAKAQPASGGVGKMVDSFDWYLLCAVDEKQALHFEQGDSIMVRMPFSAAGEFKAEVEHIAQSEDGKKPGYPQV